LSFKKATAVSFLLLNCAVKSIRVLTVHFNIKSYFYEFSWTSYCVRFT